jgi:hypothetical protein
MKLDIYATIKPNRLFFNIVYSMTVVYLLAAGFLMTANAFAGSAQIEGLLAEARTELENARDALSPERESAALSKLSEIISRGRAFGLRGGEASEFYEHIKELEFAALQRHEPHKRLRRYEAAIFQLDLLSAHCAMAQIFENERHAGDDDNGNDINNSGGNGGAPGAAHNFLNEVFEETRGHRGGETKAISSRKPGPFVTHIKEAIDLNRARAEYYSLKTGGESKTVSNRLILLEKVSLPLAAGIDLMAAGFNKKAIPVVDADFVSMDGVAPAEKPPLYKNAAPAGLVLKIKLLNRALNDSVNKAVKTADFTKICEACQDFLLTIEDIERTAGCHFALSKHIAESLGIAALNAPQYAKQSDGKTTGLSKLFIRVQALILPFCASIDASAHKSHALGAGILVNDVPHIPFKEKWEALHNAAGGR